MLGRNKCIFASEEAVEDEMSCIFKNKSNIAFVFCSSQNIDRIVSIYNAAKRSGKTTVIDLYTAYILNSVKHISEHLPQYCWNDIKVVFFPHHQKSLLQNGLEVFLDEMADHEISIDNINLTRKTSL